MAARFKYGRRQSGQATIEMALSLPFLIWLIYYTINAFITIHTSHIAQKWAANDLYERLQNRAQFVADEELNQLANRTFLAVKYMDQGNVPTRKILFGPILINNAVGICREPACN
jgi:hypothetical protein